MTSIGWQGLVGGAIVLSNYKHRTEKVLGEDFSSELRIRLGGLSLLLVVCYPLIAGCERRFAVEWLEPIDSVRILVRIADTCHTFIMILPAVLGIFCVAV